VRFVALCCFNVKNLNKIKFESKNDVPEENINLKRGENT